LPPRHIAVNTVNHYKQHTRNIKTSDKEKPDILTSVYGNKPPRAAEFGKGARDLAEIREATEASRNAKPGQYDHKR
jgi:hypothetical protein